MTVSVQLLGPNSGSANIAARIIYTAGSLLPELMAQFETWLTTHGWSVWDAAAGTNAVCYRVLQPGGTVGTTAHYTYVVFDWNQSGFVICRVYQLWDNINHVGTNKALNTYYLGASTTEAAISQRVDLVNGGYIDVHCASRYIVLLSNIPAGIGASSGGGATVVMHRTRSYAGDTLAAGYPSSVFANAANMLRTANLSYRVSLPAAPVPGAVASTDLSSPATTICLPGCMAVLTQYTFGGSAMWPNNGYGAPNASDMHVGATYQYGRIYDLLALANGAAALNDDVTVSVDGDGAVCNPATAGAVQRVYRAITVGSVQCHVLCVPW